MSFVKFIDKSDANSFKKLSKTGIKLDDVKEPVLMRDIFPYSEVPRITFEKETVPMDPPDEIFITDTSFRDGQQGHKPYSPEQIADLFELINRLGGPKGVIRQSEFFLYSKKDQQSLELCRKKGFKYPEITGWIRANKDDFKLVKEAELKETGILTSASDYHIFLKLKWTRKKAMENYLDIARSAIASEIIPRCHFEDVTRADIYGFVLPLAKELMKLQEESGMPVKIRLCDTLGFGVTSEYAALPRSIPKLVYSMTHFAGVPKNQLEWHGHNDFYRVLVGASTAWMYGCAGANGTLLGYGERTGNTAVEALCIEYAQLTGNTNGMDLTAITDIVNYFTKDIKAKLSRTKPFVGDDFNVTRAGIHADGLLKDEEIYNIFDTKKILNRPVKVSITDKSGIAGLVYKINMLFDLERKIDKTAPGLPEMYANIVKQYQEGRTTEVSDEEITVLVAEFMPQIVSCEYPKVEIRPKD